MVKSRNHGVMATYLETTVRAELAPAPTTTISPRRRKSTGASDNSERFHEDQITAPSMIIRKSVVMLEKSISQRNRAYAIFLAFSALFVVITPIFVLEKIGIIPKKPSTTRLDAAIQAYANYTNQSSNALSLEIYNLYLDSKEKVEKDCDSTTAYVYAEQDRIRNDSFQFQKYYCMDLSHRVFEVADSLSLRDQATAPGPCSTTRPNPLNPASYVSWLVLRSRLSVALKCSLPVVVDGIEYCNMHQYIQKDPSSSVSSCILPYDHDYRYDFHTGQLGVAICSDFQERMSDVYRETVRTNVIGFNESFWARLAYDNEYFLGSPSSPGLSGIFGNIHGISADISGSIPSLRTSFNSWKVEMDTNIGNMNLMYSEFLRLNALFPDQILNLGPVNPPDLTAPSIPFESLERMEAFLRELGERSDLLEDYNPPEVVFPTVDTDISYEVPPVQFQPPSVDFKASTLMNSLRNTWDILVKFVLAFQIGDWLIRLCFFIQDCAIICLEVRRDMSSFKVVLRNWIASILQMATVILYIALVIVGVVLISRTNINAAESIKNEVTSQCNNEVIVKNADILADYQNEVAAAREQCNNVISSQNAVLANISVTFLENFLNISGEFEMLYHADNPTGISWVVLGEEAAVPVNISLVNMQVALPSVRAGVGGTQIPRTSIESYSVKASICTESSEAQALGDEVNRTVQEFVDYAAQVIVVALAMILAFRFYMLGLREIFWLELTKGYAFDKEFTSKQVVSKIKKRKLIGITLISISIGTIVVLFAVYLSRS